MHNEKKIKQNINLIFLNMVFVCALFSNLTHMIFSSMDSFLLIQNPCRWEILAAAAQHPWKCPPPETEGIETE